MSLVEDNINKKKIVVKKKCPHGKQKSMCKDCGGVGVCVHGKRKQVCKECNGSGFCTHGKLKYRCKDCGGGAICIHGQRNTDCRQCGGSGICVHGKNKYRCVECGGTGVCIHDRIKSDCIPCGGSNICIHGKKQYHCLDCGGAGICVHKINKSGCRKCGTANLCIHDKFKSNCHICNIITHPHRWCLLCKHIAVWDSAYKPYCFSCYCVLNPDVIIPRQFKLKEHYLTDSLKDHYNDIEMVFDNKIVNGCSNRRPDIRIECFTHTIIIECDENKHAGYSCENKRTMEIFQDLGNRPIVFLRFNPDSYKDKITGNKIDGCFDKTNKINNSIQQNEWNKRINLLKERIDYYLANIPTKEITIEQLFYE